MGLDVMVPPFNAGRISAAPSHCSSSTWGSVCPRQLPGQDKEGAREEDGDNVLLTKLLFGLAVAGMESAEKGPGVTLGKLRMLRDKLTVRFEALRPGETVRGPTTGRADGLYSNVHGRAADSGWPWGSSRRWSGEG